MPSYDPQNDPTYGQQQPHPGQQGYGEQGYGAPARPARNGLGIAALVLGILAIVPGFFYVGVLLGIVAVVLGIMGRKRVKRGEATNGGVALAGIITGVVGFVAAAVFIAGTVFLVTSDAGQCVINANGNQAALNACTQQYGNGG